MDYLAIRGGSGCQYAITSFSLTGKFDAFVRYDTIRKKVLKASYLVINNSTPVRLETSSCQVVSVFVFHITTNLNLEKDGLNSEHPTKKVREFCHFIPQSALCFMNYGHTIPRFVQSNRCFKLY